MSNFILSVIVPVYNVENYIEECLESVLSQVNDSCEVILVDDGSTDLSGKICDKYAEKYRNVLVKHKSNGGLASARNEGLEIARGEYVAFVDSDDRVSKNGIKTLLTKLESISFDVCFMQCVKFYEDGSKVDLGDQIYEKDIINKSKEDILAFLSTRPKYPGSACTKVYRKAFLLDNGISFPKERRFSEDLGFVLDCIIKAESFNAIDAPYYEYRQNRKGSITSSFDKKKFDDLFLFIEETIEKIKDENSDSEKKCALSFLAYEYAILLWQYSKINKAEKRFALEKLKKYRHVLREAKIPKTKFINALVKFFGIRLTSKILNAYMKRR